MVNVTQAVQLAGAVLILVAFTAGQAGRLDPQALSYIVLNLVGSIALAVTAAVTSNWGFLLLEAVWAIVSAWSLIRWLGSRPQSGPDRQSAG